MKWRSPVRTRLLVAFFAAFALGCATPPPGTPDGASAPPPPGEVLRSVAVDRAVADRILALDCGRISAGDVRNALAAGPAPRIVLLHGGIYPVHLIMVSFGRFLVGMGYPEDRIRHPGDRRWSHSPYEPSEQIAGLIAWHYERDGMRPMMIGHSQGGVQAIKVLYDLAGRSAEAIPVWNPMRDAAEDRTSIVDPFTGASRPVVGLTVSQVSVVGSGGAALLLPNQWSMANRLWRIPDSVEDFTGYSIEFDLIAWTLPGGSEYKANGTAKVRNVVLPASYNHITTPITHELARDKAMREWIDAYVPGADARLGPGGDAQNDALWAADVWYDVKKHWCLESQRLLAR